MHTLFNRLLTRLPLLLALLLSLLVNPAQALELTTYYHNDSLGSPVAASDENGNQLWRESYLPYGERQQQPIASQGNRRWFTGHVEDADTGLVYMQARYYDPRIGRFMAIDPQGFTPANPVSFNRYAYANNNPYRFIDPDGEIPVLIPIAYGVYKSASLIADAIDIGVDLAAGNYVGAAMTAAGAFDPTGVTNKARKAARLADKASEVKKAKKTYYSKKDRLEAHENAGGKCEYCGKETQTHTPFKHDSAEGDHFIPQAKGGNTTPEQLVSSCRECNGPGGKGSKMPGSEWMPKRPNQRINKKLNEL